MSSALRGRPAPMPPMPFISANPPPRSAFALACWRISAAPRARKSAYGCSSAIARRRCRCPICRRRRCTRRWRAPSPWPARRPPTLMPALPPASFWPKAPSPTCNSSTPRWNGFPPTACNRWRWRWKARRAPFPESAAAREALAAPAAASRRWPHPPASGGRPPARRFRRRPWSSPARARSASAIMPGTPAGTSPISNPWTISAAAPERAPSPASTRSRRPPGACRCCSIRGFPQVCSAICCRRSPARRSPARPASCASIWASGSSAPR